VTGSGVDFRFIPTVPEDAEILCDAECFVGGVEVAGVWVAVVEDGRLVRTGVGGGGIMARFTLELEVRKDTFGFESEEEESVERKRPSSSSTGVRGMTDRPLFTEDFGACESRPVRVLRPLAGDVDERLNMSSGPIGRGSRSESSSRSESGGMKDFLRRGDGVSACELYLWGKGREEGIGDGGREGLCCACF
jgi:hypothetical protein